MENKCYRIDYNECEINNFFFTPDSDYIWCADDESAIKEAFELAKQGIDYSDIGHCDLDIVQIVEVDDESECCNDKRVIWH
jgi:hypothetical protein